MDTAYLRSDNEELIYELTELGSANDSVKFLMAYYPPAHPCPPTLRLYAIMPMQNVRASLLDYNQLVGSERSDPYQRAKIGYNKSSGCPLCVKTSDTRWVWPNAFFLVSTAKWMTLRLRCMRH